MRFALASISLYWLVAFSGSYMIAALPPPGLHYFQQTLDHENASSVLFQQRYWVSTEFYKPGGPVFLSIDGEGLDLMRFHETFCSYYAKEIGAMCLVLEHRYYGESSPIDLPSCVNDWPGGCKSWPPGTFKYLSSDRALEDVRSFIEFARGAFDLQDNKWVVFGESYAAALAAWARQMFPDLIYAAVASSAPLEARMDYSYFRRHNTTRSSLRHHGDHYPGDAWFYQTCTEFGWYNIRSNVPGNMTAIVEATCSKYHEGITVSTLQRGIDRINKKHRGKNFFMERVIFTHGSIDDWRLAGITKSPCQSRMPVYIIPGAKHSEDTAYPPDPIIVNNYPPHTDVKKLIAEISKVEVKVLKRLQQWL